MNNKNSPHQSGFVAIIVAALIMVILSLITIGFTRVMQREARQALDRQLSKQALYAAESGINDIYGSLKNNPDLPSEKTTCDVVGLVNGQQNPAKDNGFLDSDGTIAYTCALYDKTPTELPYSLSTTESVVVELITESSNPFNDITFKWGNESGNNDISTLPNCGANANTFPSSRVGNIPLIRIDLTNTNTLSRDSLINGTDYMYVAPCKGSGGSVATVHLFNQSAAKGQIVQVACSVADPAQINANLPCELNIDVSSLPSNTYAVRVRSVYDSAKAVITAKEISPGGVKDTVEFKRAQTSIDVTAKANDVVRRLRVAIPFKVAEKPPEAVFQAFDGVCKQLSVDTVSSPARISDSCSY